MGFPVDCMDLSSLIMSANSQPEIIMPTQPPGPLLDGVRGNYTTASHGRKFHCDPTPPPPSGWLIDELFSDLNGTACKAN